MASVAFHNMNQFLEHGHVRLFAGWDGYVDGGQSRDFISVEDVVAVNLHFLDNPGRRASSTAARAAHSRSTTWPPRWSTRCAPSAARPGCRWRSWWNWT